MLKPPTTDFESVPFDSVICNQQRMFEDIPRNVWQDSPDFLATFPGI